MTKMILTDLVQFFKERDLNQTASYIAGYPVTEDGMIPVAFVRNHVGDGLLMREIESSVTTYWFSIG